METKTCSKCGCQKPLNEFRFRKDINKYRNDCKQCNNKYSCKWRAEHPDKCKEYSRKWDAEYPDKIKESHHKYHQSPKGKMVCKNRRHNRRAQTKGQKLTLEEWTVIKEQQGYRCFWCRRKFKEEKLTQDHVIPLDKGGLHEASNIVAACQPCNSSKGVKIWSLA